MRFSIEVPVIADPRSFQGRIGDKPVHVEGMRCGKVKAHERVPAGADSGIVVGSKLHFAVASASGEFPLGGVHDIAVL